MEYKTLHFTDDSKGKREADIAIAKYAKEGWKLKSRETNQQGYAAGKTCCLGVLFLPLALLGKKKNEITITLERKEKK